MANLSMFNRNTVRFSKLIISRRWEKIGSSNHYSVFNPTYVPPVFKKEEQAVLRETGEISKLSHVPIKPPFNNQTSSEFHDYLVRKFTNYINKKGRKALARMLLEQTFENIKRIQLERYHKTEADPVAQQEVELDPKIILHRAIANSKPVLELIILRRGGIRYQVPAPMTPHRQMFLSMNWLLDAARDREDRKVHLPDRLAYELIDAAYNQGRVIKKKQDLHKQCEANRAYAHFRWT